MMRKTGGIRRAGLVWAFAVIVCVLTLALVFCSCRTAPDGRAAAADGGRIVQDFNTGWRFQKGPLTAENLAEPDDASGQSVRLPHDWAVAGPFNESEHGYSAKLPWKGTGRYSKRFTLDPSWSGRRVYLDFDGVMAFPKVYVNGRLAGEWDYGYVSFRVDATPYVKFGEENRVVVEVDTRRQGTRWYPGAGIYRKVTMTICEPVHLGHWATFVTTPEVKDESATVNIRSTVENHGVGEANVRVRFDLYDPEGKPAGGAEQAVTVGAGGSQEVEETFEIGGPQRWDIISPRLYTARVAVQSGKAADAETVSFGIRTFEFTADDGFHLNGRRVPLYGVNLHHDHGPLGAAFYPRAMERQLEIMREMGVNAIRTSHNPPAPELPDLCDRMGFVVWNEAFDKWDDKAGRVKGEPPLEAYGEKQIRNFVMRDRNHPSIVVWSIGNEINNQPHDREGKSAERVRFMRDFVLKYDPTRPVGMGCHIPQTANQPILDALDLAGWNYARRYAIYRQNYPDKPIIYSESASALSTRGFYELPLPTTKTDYSETFQVDSYDLNAAPWSDIADREFELMEDDSFVAGEFVWTGFDYLGEPTPFDREARSSYFGIVDLCGIPKDRFYLYRSYWRPEEPTVHILPHWNWPEGVGQKVPVFVYTNGDEAELFLNGRSLGRRKKGIVPERPESFTRGLTPTVSSEQGGNIAAHATDGDKETRWCADSDATDQRLVVDLKEARAIRGILVEFERAAKYYGYEIHVSGDGADWRTLAVKPATDKPSYGGPRESLHTADETARYVRIVFNELRSGAWASIRRFDVYPEPVESDYYQPTYRYRLRWNDVVYQPGELKAVAYKDGNEIGTAVMRTAGKPAALRLTPDRTELAADGWDLSYVLVEALDADGSLCPLADNFVRFEVSGPAEIAGVGNGNPMSFEPFQADYRKLFYGKAMLILRTVNGKPGPIRVTARADGLRDGQANLSAGK